MELGQVSAVSPILQPSVGEAILKSLCAEAEQNKPRLNPKKTTTRTRTWTRTTVCCDQGLFPRPTEDEGECPAERARDSEDGDGEMTISHGEWDDAQSEQMTW